VNNGNRPLATLLALSLVGAAAPQAPPPPQQPAPVAPVVRVTTSLVQVDAVVTDKDGRHVTDLTAADFEIFEDGRKQEITHCSYAALPKLATPPPAAPSPASATIPPPPPAPSRLRPERVRRTLALVVDDLGLSFRSTVELREALRKFVDRQMEPGDLVAIIRTRGGMGALQQFTSDKAQLHAAIDRVRFNAGLNRMGVDWAPPIGEGKNLIDANTGPRGSRGGAGSTVDGLRESMLIEATLHSITFVVAGLRELPGRKGVVVFSDGLRMFQDVTQRQMIGASGTRGRAGSGTRREAARITPGTDPRVTGALGQLIDFANRSSVVLYTVDTRGVVTRGFTAADDLNTAFGAYDLNSGDLTGQLDDRRRLALDSEAGLQYVAQETGGFLVRAQNDLSRAVERVLDDQRGYYLIGYSPDADSFKGREDRPQFHKIKISVKRSGLSVRSRKGFFGRIDEGGASPQPAEAKPLRVVLASPFSSGDIRLQLTSLFVHEPQRGYLMRSLFHVDTRDLQLQDMDGMLGTKLELLALTFGDNGAVVDELARMQEIRVAKDQLDKALVEGLTYRLDVPVKKPGAYQLRVAIRDTSTGRVGTANQLVQVPDLDEKELALSGIVVGSVPAEGTAAEPLGTEATAALRRFRPGQALSYGYAVYNAKLDKATGLPRLDSQMRLFRDGEPLTVGEKRPIEVGAGGSSVVASGGAFVLGPEMPPGDYVLQVIVTDALAGKKTAVVTQAVDFEVRP
jgi:VWFA-related protein